MFAPVDSNFMWRLKIKFTISTYSVIVLVTSAERLRLQIASTKAPRKLEKLSAASKFYVSSIPQSSFSLNSPVRQPLFPVLEKSTLSSYSSALLEHLSRNAVRVARTVQLKNLNDLLFSFWHHIADLSL